jgi:5-methylcytosine-specific restriction endonuclease McrA
MFPKPKAPKRPPVGKLGIKRLKGSPLKILRMDCFERDEYRCQHMVSYGGLLQMPCGRRVTWESGHMCHRTSRGAGGSDALDNVFTGCAECHMRSHNAGGKPVPAKER